MARGWEENNRITEEHSKQIEARLLFGRTPVLGTGVFGDEQDSGAIR